MYYVKGVLISLGSVLLVQLIVFVVELIRADQHNLGATAGGLPLRSMIVFAVTFLLYLRFTR